MPLTPRQLTERLEQGKQREIATRAEVSFSYVSLVARGAFQPRTERGRRTVRRIQVAIARSLGMKWSAVFPLVMDAETTQETAPLAAVS